MAQAWHAPSAGKLVRAGWERISVYLPVILMGLLALGTYWLARNTPMLSPVAGKIAPRHEPDAYMRNFSVKSFDAAGHLRSEVRGLEARHFPDTDTLEIDQPRIRAYGEQGQVTVATAQLGISNADGSEVQLIGDAVVTREPSTAANGHAVPRMRIRGEFLHVFVNAERLRSHKPVELERGDDRFTADAMEYDNLSQVLDLHGSVRGTIQPRMAQP